MKTHILLILLLISAPGWSADVSGKVELFEKSGLSESKVEKVEGVAVYLMPKDEATKAKLKDIPPVYQMLNQKNKEFMPKMVVIQKGGEVRFGNEDPWFHNIYGNDPKFDLGRFPKGFWKKQVYEKTGVFHVYCDIHPNMHAHVYVVDTPYYTKAAEDGGFVLKDIAQGEYQIIAWQIRSKTQSQDITVTEENIEGIQLELHETQAKTSDTKNNQPYARSLLRKQE